MVSNPNLAEKFNQVRRNFCFYLDIQDHELSKSLSRRLQDMGFKQEVFLSSRVTHVVRDHPNVAGVGAEVCAGGGVNTSRWRREGRTRADAMLERVRPEHLPHQPVANNSKHIQLTVQKAINLLDKLYDTFFTAPRKTNFKVFSKQFIKIEFLDKPCRPIYKEFDLWPEISLAPDPPKEKTERPNKVINNNTIKPNSPITAGQKMTRKSRPRIREKEEKEAKGGYCEMCNTDYVDAALHRQSQTHLAFVKDHNNFLALDSLISAGADMTTFLDKTTPINGERRSLRKICNGEAEPSKNRRSMRSQSPDSTVNGNQSPKRNGGLEDERKHNTRCSKKSSDSQLSEDRQYYKVVGISTKLRSSGGFGSKTKDSPSCNGTKPLVVKFRKVRRSELSVLSDEAEQFMFPKRASSTSSTSSDDDDDDDDAVVAASVKRKSPPEPPIMLERRRLARPLALKEESSEEDSWIEDKRSKNWRKRRAPAVIKRARKMVSKVSAEKIPADDPIPDESIPTIAEPTIIAHEVTSETIATTTAEPTPTPEVSVSPLREEPTERCMKWEDGKLKYTPAVEQLEFAFESVPHSEPWYETFKRQDQDKVATKNVPRVFELYSKSPKLPYEIGQLPPLKANCCPLSDLVKRDEKPGPSRSYGTRGMKKQRTRKRTDIVLALEGHPRKSPREHASTLAILGSAGLLHRRKNAEDAKSTASEDTISDTHSTTKVESVLSEVQEASERLQQFLSEIFEDPNDYDVPDDAMDGELAVTTLTTAPDVLNLVSECEKCDIIRNEMKDSVQQPKGRRGRFKKKNRTGWPKKKKPVKKDSRTNSLELENFAESSLDRSSAEPPDDTTQETAFEDDATLSETDNDKTLAEVREAELVKYEMMEIDAQESKDTDEDDKPLKLDVKVLVQDKVKTEKIVPKELEDKKTASSASESEDKEDKMLRKKKSVQPLGDWLQPVVRVARVDPNAARRLRSASRNRSNMSR